MKKRTLDFQSLIISNSVGLSVFVHKFVMCYICERLPLRRLPQSTHRGGASDFFLRKWQCLLFRRKGRHHQSFAGNNKLITLKEKEKEKNPRISYILHTLFFETIEMSPSSIRCFGVWILRERVESLEPLVTDISSVIVNLPEPSKYPGIFWPLESKDIFSSKEKADLFHSKYESKNMCF